MDREEKVCIEKWDAKGRGISTEPRRYAVVGTVPGDEVRICLGKKGKGHLLEVIQPSSMRISPRCKHVPSCGGCSWQHVQYEQQLAEKQRKIDALFAPLLDEGVCVNPILPCPDPWRYRNKMEFSFSQDKGGNKFLGLILAGSRGHVFCLEECHLSPEWFACMVRETLSWWEKTQLYAHRLNGTGTLRTLTLREGFATKDKMVILTVSGNPAYPITKRDLEAFCAGVRNVLPDQERVSIFLRVQQCQKGYPTQFYEMHLAGPDHILEQLSILGKTWTFKISPTSFFQPNPRQAAVLYERAIQMVGFPHKHVWDLYAGTATLGMVIASLAEKVTAVEINPYAIFDAKSNQELNEVRNLELICADVEQVCRELSQKEPYVPPSLVVLDPPRAGLGPQVTALLGLLQPEQILYISCQVQTQAEDLRALRAHGYQISAVQPVDQFPHTVHVENIVVLRARPNTTSAP